jgi:hypothetical protein
MADFLNAYSALDCLTIFGYNSGILTTIGPVNMLKIEIPTLEQLMSFFFEASLVAGWCNPDAVIKKWESGMRSVRYERDGLRYDDAWFVGEAMPGPGWSRGNTTISVGECQVFTMSYGGYYPEYMGVNLTGDLVMPALIKAYGDSEFNGGRGPERFHNPDHPTLWYRNECNFFDPNGARRLLHFSGRERVDDIPPIPNLEGIAGWHYYSGMTLGLS